MDQGDRTAITVEVATCLYASCYPVGSYCERAHRVVTTSTVHHNVTDVRDARHSGEQATIVV